MASFKQDIQKMRNAFLLFCLCISCTHAFAQSSADTNVLPEWALGNFVRPAQLNPIVSPDGSTYFNDPMSSKKVTWESDNTFNPAATVKDGKVVLLYRAEDASGEGIGHHTSRIGYAASNDGLHFRRSPLPVLYPGNDSQKENEWPGGCEDPRVAVTVGGRYVMLYTQWNKKMARLGVATSRDLKHWQKHGPAFQQAYGGKFSKIWSKSAAIVTRIEAGKQVIAKINGKYWMYWGENHIYLATSNDLVNWTPLTDEKGDLKELASPRKGFFDSDLTECGPPAVLTDKGILLIYNGKNAGGTKGDTHYGAGSYCAGQILFDKNDPEKVLGRLDKPLFYPSEPFEKSGQYAAGTVFMEGLVYFKKKWFLYYGCADSHVAVAVYDPSGR